ncbi:MAG TPA: 3-hydroxyacyl-CoA dehydrogenase family protein [Planctomycetota bacterium]|jgi:3-hydroxybutyryl-CoA dehydrogenase|nr:3-hydroxyacyl-CoA dehydrogenase family protein [Planctomycetota bacterium]
MINLTHTTIGVAGAGTMGAGIAQTFAAAGASVCLYDTSSEAVERGMKRIGESAAKLSGKGKSPPAAEVLRNIQPITRLADFEPCAWIVEAVFEDLAVKTKLFAELPKVTRNNCILASNTSSIPIAKLSAAVAAVDHPRAARVLGLHFMNPVPIMQLVEVVRPQGLEGWVLENSLELMRVIGKTPVVVADVPGFVANRVLMPYINEGFILLERGVADPEGIDTICKLGFAHPMGPLTLADLIGLDVCLNVLKVIHQQLGPEDGVRFKPAQKLQDLVAAGKLGRKSGEGVYKY